jgi:hypothetical protein
MQPFIHGAPTERPAILAVLGNTPTPINSPKKPILQEDPTFHPSLIDLDCEVNPLPYSAAASLQPEAAGSPEPPHFSASLSAPPALVSRLVRGLRPCRQREEAPEEEPSSTSTGPPILLVRALGVVLVPMGDAPISIGLFQVVTCTTGKPRILLFLRTLEA